MYKWVQNTFALSEEGSRTFVRGVVWTFLHFVSLMFPMMMLFYFLMEQMGIGEFAGKTPHGTLFYVGIAAVLFIVMLVIYRFSYSATYSSVYDESMRRRVSIAEKLRKLPLSFFGKKNLSDLTSTIMDDCNALEMIFSHAVPELFAAIGSVTIIGIMLFCYNWKMSIALFWVVPAAALLIALSKKIQDRWFENSYNARRVIMEDIQEGLENVQEIRSYSGETAYLNHFDKDCIKYEKSQMDSDVKVGSFLNSAQGILKMGLATVLITGARLWTKGEIDVFTYLVFIVCAATVYNPVYLVFNNLAELFFVNVRLRRFREMDQMIGLLLVSNRQNRTAFEYLMAYEQLNGDINRFEQYYPLGQHMSYDHVPSSYLETRLVYWAQHSNQMNQPPAGVSQLMGQRFMEFGKQLSQGGSLESFRGTYWYYFAKMMKK